MREAVDRVVSPAGVAALAALTVLGVLRTGARNDLTEAFIRGTMDWLWDHDPSVAGELQPHADELLSWIELAFGLDPWLAALLWLAAVTVSLLLVVPIVAAFASDEARLRDLRPAGFLRKTVRLSIAGSIAGIVVAVGLAIFVLPGLAAMVAFAYVAPAIVVDDEATIASLRSSIDLARSAIGETIAMVALCVLATSIGSSAGQFLRLATDGPGGTIFAIVLASLSWLFVGALVTRGYVGLTDPQAEANAAECSDPPSGADASEDSAPSSDTGTG